MGVLPIGLFAPFPLAMMIPFMAGQSLAMGEAFGKGFQYGKRKISSMSNEDFNALDFKGLSESVATDYKVMIPSMQQSLIASQKLQDEVFRVMGTMVKGIPNNILDFFSANQTQGTTTTSTSASALGSELVNVRSTVGARDRDYTVNEQGIIDAYNALQATGEFFDPLNPKNLKSKSQKEQDRINENNRRIRAERALAARIKQGKENERILNLRRAREAAVKYPRWAGQSQIRERKLLIQQIAAEARSVATTRRQIRSGSTSNIKRAAVAASDKRRRAIQIRLESLLRRYKFK